ncbi:ribbon-helix-helix domain-containing protein [Bosea sp. (in: a-proteobacteria)]|uniref:ribbon-helix-helix domain-containing protein n=1 Tax=Bosea sp. (in: a-proteobacteria) TaxID=1871050 RepID=UPI003F72B897
MKHVTITLPEATLSRLRVEAAKEGKSMSKFTAELIEQRVGRTMTQREALDVFLAGPDLPGLAASWQGRGELYDERLFRRHERDAVSEGSAGSSEADDRAELDRRTRGA